MFIFFFHTLMYSNLVQTIDLRFLDYHRKKPRSKNSIVFQTIFIVLIQLCCHWRGYSVYFLFYGGGREKDE